MTPEPPATPPRPPLHPIVLVPGAPGDGRMEEFLPDGLEWAETGADPVADAVSLLRAMNADRSALTALTGFAGLERLLIWAKARLMARQAPTGVRIGPTTDRQLSWLRRVQGPAQLSDIVDLINPRVDRHRSMPDVFGDRARRARLLESLWEWGRSWQAIVDAGGVHLRAGGELDASVVDVATWIGVVVDDEPDIPRPTLTMADLGVGGDGARLYRMRVRAPLHLAFPEFSAGVDGESFGGLDGDLDGADEAAVGVGATEVRRQAFSLDDDADPADSPDAAVHVDASEAGVVVQVAGFSRRFPAPAIIGVCEMEKVRVSPPDSWDSGWGDILVWFRADPARLP